MSRRAPVWPFVLAAATLPLGLVIGGLGPRQEARALRAALEAAPKECASDGSVGREIAQVFRGRPLEGRLPSAPSPAAGGEEGDPEVAPDGAPAAEPGDGRPDFLPDVPEGASPEEAMRLAREGLALRAAQARAALEEAGATEAQLARVDATMDAMNDDLAALTEEFVATVKEGGEPDRREMMIFASDTLDVLLTAEDTLYDTFDAEMREGLDEAALDPFSYVDGRVVDQLSKLEGL